MTSRMKRSSPIVAILSSLALPALAQRPNLLFLVSEDNSEQIGCYGEERYKLIHNPVRMTSPVAISRYELVPVPEFLWNPDYVHPPESELYDLKTDPDELTNLPLGKDPQHEEKRKELFAAMRSFQEEIGDPFLDPDNIDFYLREMNDPSRHPKKKSEEVWGHLREFRDSTPGESTAPPTGRP